MLMSHDALAERLQSVKDVRNLAYKHLAELIGEYLTGKGSTNALSLEQAEQEYSEAMHFDGV